MADQGGQHSGMGALMPLLLTQQMGNGDSGMSPVVMMMSMMGMQHADVRNDNGKRPAQVEGAQDIAQAVREGVAQGIKTAGEAFGKALVGVQDTIRKGFEAMAGEVSEKMAKRVRHDPQHFMPGFIPNFHPGYPQLPGPPSSSPPAILSPHLQGARVVPVLGPQPSPLAQPQQYTPLHMLMLWRSPCRSLSPSPHTSPFPNLLHQ